MECKDISPQSLIGRLTHWNISRMECKEVSFSFQIITSQIGIYPEWNVKLGIGAIVAGITMYWNISRMECKVVNVA